MTTTIKVTKYFVLNQQDYSQNNTIPMKNNDGDIITMIDPICYGDAACEGTIKLNNGTICNVSGKWVPIDNNSAMLLKNVADTRYKGRYNYVGLSADFKKYLSFNISNTAFGTGAWKNTPLYPFISCAIDPLYYSYGTILYCPTLKDKLLPSNETHSGYLQAIDCGGGIKGQNRLDLFCGTKTWAKQLDIPDYMDMEIYKKG